MPNYYRNRYNNFIDHAEEINAYLTDEYMRQYDNVLLDQGTDHIETGRMQYIRVLQYRRGDSVQSDFERIRSVMRTNLRYSAGLDSAFGYFIVSENGTVSIYLAIEDYSAERFITNMSALIPEVRFSTGFISSEKLKRLSQYGGLVNGNVECDEIVVDRILSALEKGNGIIGLLAVPMDNQEVFSYTAGLSGLKQISENLLRDDAVQNRRVNKRSYGYVAEIDSYLKKRIDYFSNASEEFWKFCIWFGCEQEKDLMQLGNVIKGAYNSGSRDGIEKAKCHFTVHNPFQTGEMELALADYSNTDYIFEPALRKSSLLSYISTADLASIIQLPAYSVKGFEVIELEKDKNSLRLFDKDNKEKTSSNFRLGTYSEDGRPFYLELEDFKEHVLVTGATGSGKTNTVLGIIKNLNEKGIPILIIEPGKKEYWKLAPDIKNLKIYSFGQDAEPLNFNLLVPEEGTILINHIDSLMYAFSGAFEMEPATKEALNGLLNYAYERFGWNLNEVVYHSGRRFPKIQDLLTLLPQYVETELKYGEEVKSNVFGSLMVRLSNLNSSVIGSSANTNNSITGKDLCHGVILVELDDLSLDMKPFVAMLLMIKVEQYLRQQNTVSSFGNIIILEEAHNVFADIPDGKAISDKDKASETFSNMLSQMRSYGTGIVIVDQGASCINQSAIANTKIKIINGSQYGEDIDRLKLALNLTDYQKRVFQSLAPGEGIVAVRGNRIVSKVQSDYTPFKHINNMACLFCPVRRTCTDYNKRTSENIPEKSLYAQEIFDARFDSKRLNASLRSIATYLNWPSDRFLCLLGILLEDESIQCSDRAKRRIIRAFMEEA